MPKTNEINKILQKLKISLPREEILETYSKKALYDNPEKACELLTRKNIKISDKILKKLIRFHARVLDVKEQKSNTEPDLAIMLIGNLCNLKPPKKNIIDLLAKSLRKLEKLNPFFLPLMIGKNNPNFSILVYTNSLKQVPDDHLNSFDELKGNTIHFGNNKAMILLNTSALGFYAEDVFFHELLHVIDDMVVSNKSEKKSYFHEILNKQYDNILNKAAHDYKQNQKKAHLEFAQWLKNNYLPEDHDAQVKILKEAIEEIYYKKYKIWAADENMAEQLLVAKKFLGKEIGNSAEVFAYSLQYYMASAHRRKILKKRAPELYNLIKDIVIPVLKKLKPE